MPTQLAEKLREIDPRLSSCKADFFTAFDPPRALEPVSALLPAQPAGAPNPAPVPSPTDVPEPRETIAGQAAAPEPPSVPTVDQPKETIDPAPTPKDESPATQAKSNDPAENRISPAQDQHNAGDPNTDNDRGSEPGSGKGPNRDTSENAKGNSENEAGLGKSRPLSQITIIVSSNGPPNINPDLDSNDDSKQTDATGRTNEEPAQNSSPAHLIGTPTSLDPSDGPALANGAPALADPVTTINNQIVQPLSHGVSVAGTILTPGAPAITASGTPISLGSSAFFVGASTVPILFQHPDPLVTTVAGHPITAAPGAVNIAGTTLYPGIPGVTLGGTAMSLDTSNNIIIGSSTIALSDEKKGFGRLILGGVNDQSNPSVAEPYITSIAGHAITAAPNAVDVAGTTLHPGDPGMTFDGTAVSLDTANHLVIGSKTIPLARESSGLGSLILEGLGHPSTSDDDAAQSLITTIAGQPITAGPNAVQVAGSTLRPDAPGLTLDGTLISLDTAKHLIVGPKTIALPTGEGSHPPSSDDNSDPLITTVAGQVITAAPDAVEVAGSIFRPGDPGTTLDGTVISLDTARHLIIGSQTIVLPTGASGPSDPLITTIAGQPITAAPSAVALAGKTLLPGAPGQIINGTLVSLNTAGQLVVGSKTVALPGENGTFFSAPPLNGTGNRTDSGGGGGEGVFEGRAAALTKEGLSSVSLLVSFFIVVCCCCLSCTILV